MVLSGWESSAWVRVGHLFMLAVVPFSHSGCMMNLWSTNYMTMTVYNTVDDATSRAHPSGARVLMVCGMTRSNATMSVYNTLLLPLQDATHCATHVASSLPMHCARWSGLARANMWQAHQKQHALCASASPPTLCRTSTRNTRYGGDYFGGLLVCVCTVWGIVWEACLLPMKPHTLVLAHQMEDMHHKHHYKSSKPKKRRPLPPREDDGHSGGALTPGQRRSGRPLKPSKVFAEYSVYHDDESGVCVCV